MKGRISLEDFWVYANGNRKIELSRADIKSVRASRIMLGNLARRGEVYGSNRGVGPFLNETIGGLDTSDFQANLLRSHAVGEGDLIARAEARGMMFLLINMLRKGYSGISLDTLKHLLLFFNKDIIPAIPSQGSLGASGDLAPLAHLALVLIGEGSVLSGGDVPVPTKYVHQFEKGFIKPIKLKAGEALALINGTHFMTSILGLAYKDAEEAVRKADAISALTLLALHANPRAFSEEIHSLRPHEGQAEVAKNIRNLISSALTGKNLQDAYSLRCTPQVHGPVREALGLLKKTLDIEINSISGNPIFQDGEVWHGGNFHGHPLALSADFMSIALTTLSNISERRIDRILNADFLPKFLAPHSAEGNYGMMMSQYTAAALVSENKTLSHPASVDSIPTAGGQEDYVSMGAWAARKFKKVCQNTAKVLAIEKECAFRALELQNIKIPNPLEEALRQ